VVHVDGANRVVELGADPAAPSPGVLGQVRGDVVRGDTIAS
jgi:aspartate 1-decarboxylase